MESGVIADIPSTAVQCDKVPSPHRADQLSPPAPGCSGDCAGTDPVPYGGEDTTIYSTSVPPFGRSANISRTSPFLCRISWEMQTALRWLLVMASMAMHVTANRRLLQVSPGEEGNGEQHMVLQNEKVLTAESSNQAGEPCTSWYIRVEMVVSGTTEGLWDAYSRDAPPASTFAVDFKSFWHNNNHLSPSFSSSDFTACAPDPWSLHWAVFVGIPLTETNLPGRANQPGSGGFLVESRCAWDGSLWPSHSGAILLPRLRALDGFHHSRVSPQPSITPTATTAPAPREGATMTPTWNSKQRRFIQQIWTVT